MKIDFSDKKFRTVAGAAAAVLAIFLLFISRSQSIKVQPAVFDFGGDSYSVVFTSGAKGTGYIKYTLDGEEKIITSQNKGTDTVHSISVPKSELRDNTYTVGAQTVSFGFIKGRRAQSKPITFRGTEKDDDIRLLAASDAHGRTDDLIEADTFYLEDFDMVLLLGDITDKLKSKKSFTKDILANAAYLSESEIPVVLSLGEAEAQGRYAEKMLSYFPTAENKAYFTLEFGALAAVVLNTGAENNAEYNAQQYEWIESLDEKDVDGRYQLVFSHNPEIDSYNGKNWMTPLKQLEAQLIAGGHHHKSGIEVKDLLVFNTCGIFDEGFALSTITLTNDLIMMKTISTDGEVLVDNYLNIWEANHREETEENNGVQTEEESTEATE